MFDPETEYGCGSDWEHRDVRPISVDRRQVEKGDTSTASEELDELIASQNRGQELETRVLFRFAGYDREDRYLHEIPEVSKWFAKLETRYPYLLCLLSNQRRQLLDYVMMFVPYEADGAKVRFERKALVKFLRPRLRQAASYGGAVGMDRGEVKLRVLRAVGIRESMDDFL